MNRQELILLLELLPLKLNIKAMDQKNKGRICIGMVGYPNVGKSSVINTIMGVSKSTHGVVRVGVSSTPGKTKHFQTLMVSDSVMLCDCPGLVFPSFMRSTGEMLCAGILPINQMRDFIAPASVVAARVETRIIEATYGITVVRHLDFKDDPDRPPTAHELLAGYCKVHGYITSGSGNWDEFRACKDILRDLADGRILYNAPPQGLVSQDDSSEKIAKWLRETEKVACKNERVAERMAMTSLRNMQIIEEGEEEEEEVEVKVSKPTVLTSDGFEVVDDSSDEDGDVDKADDDDDEDEEAGPKSEHKRIKRWGKKNRKLKDKDPYSEANGTVAFVAYTTNRSRPGETSTSKGGSRTGHGDAKLKRHDAKVPYGREFKGSHHEPVPPKV